jgi:arginine repressor
MSVYAVPLNHESKTEDFLFFIFKDVSQAYKANMVYMNTAPGSMQIATSEIKLNTERLL